MTPAGEDGSQQARADEGVAGPDHALSRRVFMQRAGAVALASALAQLPVALDARGLLAAARAQTVDLTKDTFNALIAVGHPGNDAYSGVYDPARRAPASRPVGWRGSDPSNSVLDENAEARFVRRLFVADNSALANALGGPNPTLTSQALATRTAEKIFTGYFGGDPWVGREAPTSSIDDRVTAAVFRRDIADAPRTAQRRPRRRRRRRRQPDFAG